MPVGASRAGIFGSGSGSAIPDSGIDNFSDTDLDEYTISYGSANAVSTSETVYNGYGLDVTDPSTFLHSNEGGGLPYYPTQDDVIYALVQDPSGSPNPFVAFNQSDGNGYSVLYQGGGGNLRIYKTTESDATNNELNNTSLNISTGTWYWLVIYPPTSSNNTITAEFRNADTSEVSSGNLSASVGSLIVSVSANDSEYIGQKGVGFGTNAGSGSGITTDIITVNL